MVEASGGGMAPYLYRDKTGKCGSRAGTEGGEVRVDFESGRMRQLPATG